MVRSLGINAKHRRRRHRHTRGTAVLAVLIVASAALTSAAETSAAEPKTSAHAAHTLSGTATARLHLVRAEGSQLIEEGPVSGALTGSASADLHTGAVFTARFTIKTNHGTISGRGQATPHGSGRYQSFRGTFYPTSGNGRYTHISGHAGLYGVFDARTDSVVIQTTTSDLTY
jgi:hypothetical protein